MKTGERKHHLIPNKATPNTIERPRVAKHLSGDRWKNGYKHNRRPSIEHRSISMLARCRTRSLHRRLNKQTLRACVGSTVFHGGNKSVRLRSPEEIPVISNASIFDGARLRQTKDRNEYGLFTLRRVKMAREEKARLVGRGTAGAVVWRSGKDKAGTGCE